MNWRAVRMGGWTLLPAFILMFGMSFTPLTGQTKSKVDLVLVLAIDSSFSVDDTEFDLQRGGIAAAIESPEVIAAIRAGRIGRIAIQVVQWAGFAEQIVAVEWDTVSDAKDASRLARQIIAMKRHFRGKYTTGATDISGLVDFAAQATLASPFASLRHVIDISGDGKNNVNLPPDKNRDAAVNAGLVINGLAVVHEVPDLADYYRRHVTGGLGSFVETALGYEDFQRAIQRKLLREISAPYYS